MTVQQTTLDYVARFAEAFVPATAHDYSVIMSTREILSSIHTSNLRDDVDAESLEAELRKAGYLTLSNGSGVWWMLNPNDS